MSLRSILNFRVIPLTREKGAPIPFPALYTRNIPSRIIRKNKGLHRWSTPLVSTKLLKGGGEGLMQLAKSRQHPSLAPPPPSDGLEPLHAWFAFYIGNNHIKKPPRSELWRKFLVKWELKLTGLLFFVMSASATNQKGCRWIDIFFSPLGNFSIGEGRGKGSEKL